MMTSCVSDGFAMKNDRCEPTKKLQTCSSQRNEEERHQHAKIGEGEILLPSSRQRYACVYSPKLSHDSCRYAVVEFLL